MGIDDKEDVGSGRLEHLVVAMSELPGITVEFQQGGGPARDPLLQNAFQVGFDVDILSGGWRGLETIVRAISNSEQDFVVTLAIICDPEGTLAFTLDGEREADPCKLAQAIEDDANTDWIATDDDTAELN